MFNTKISQINQTIEDFKQDTKKNNANVLNNFEKSNTKSQQFDNSLNYINNKVLCIVDLSLNIKDLINAKNITDKIKKML